MRRHIMCTLPCESYRMQIADDFVSHFRVWRHRS